MKKIKFFGMLIACLTAMMTFTACGDDDEPNNSSSSADIVGSWRGDMMFYYNGVEEEADGWARAEFNEDGTCYVSYKRNGAAWSRDWYDGNYTIGKKTIHFVGTMSWDGAAATYDFDVEYPFEFRGDKLFLHWNNDRLLLSREDDN